MAKNECEMRGSRKGQTNMAYFRNALTLLVLQYRKLSCFNGMSSETLGNNFARESKMTSFACFSEFSASFWWFCQLVDVLPCIPTKLSLGEGPTQLTIHKMSDRKVNKISCHCHIAIWDLLRGGPPFNIDAVKVWAPFTINAFKVWISLHYWYF